MLCTHTAILNYEQTLQSGQLCLIINLFPAIPQSIGPVHDVFIEYFSLAETGEIPGLVSLRAGATIEKFLLFFGRTYDEACQRWPGLSFIHDWRSEGGKKSGDYTEIENWQLFFRLLNEGVEPTKIKLEFIEHY